MRTKEIPEQAWSPFFSDFSLLHQGQRVNVETLHAGHSAVTSHIRRLPLVGIATANPNAGTGEWIEIVAGDSAQAHATHSVPDPTHVRLAEEENGDAVAVQIESDQDLITMVRFEQTCEGMPPGFTIA